MISNDVDIEKIMQEIRQEIDENGYDEKLIRFEDVSTVGLSDIESFDMAQFEQVAVELPNQALVQTYWQLTSHRPVIGKLLVFMRKVIRKMVSFYIEPIVEQQNAFNVTAARGMQYAVRFAQQVQQENELLASENQALRKLISDLHGQLEQHEKEAHQ